jgi:hypothetical protein
LFLSSGGSFSISSILSSYSNAGANGKYKFTEKERDTETNYDYFACPP